MSDTKNPGDKTISVERGKTLGLKRGGGDQGTVRQSFSHGRSKAVVVEKKKRRVVIPGQDPKPEAPAPTTQRLEKPSEAPRKPQQPDPQAAKQARRAASGQRQKGNGNVLRTLTKEEAAARAAALQMAKEREVVERKQREEDEKRRAVEAAQRQAEEEERAKVEAQERAQREAEEARHAEEKAKAEPASAEAPGDAEQREPAGADAQKAAAAGREAQRRPAPSNGNKPRSLDDMGKRKTAPSPRPKPEAQPAAPEDDRANKGLRSVKRPKQAPTPTTRPRAGDDRRRSKLTISAATGGDDGQRARSLASMRRRQEKAKRGQQQVVREKISREVTLPEAITIQELANRMAERAVDVIKLLMKQGQMLKINDVIDADTAELIAEEMGHTVKRVSEADVEEGLFTQEDDTSTLQSRPPVVTIMGHVDHGKTSLLDAIRKSKVVTGEAGGITQHIGAYQVDQDGQKITFIDTPGHAAFSQMRARGAKSTDIVILVVAADDGVMPQTKEAIAHAKAAEAPIIVAINKIDKPGADPNRVRTELLSEELVTESMGGDIIDVEVSALNGTNLDKLLEMILLQAEVLELQANPERTAEGIVIEAQLDRGRGPVATVLVQKGTLKPGDILVAGSEWGRVRAMLDENGKQVKEAGPAKPVEVLGFQGTPAAGDQVAVVENEARAREITDYRLRQIREKASVVASGARGSLEQMMNRLQETGRKEFPLVLKADVQGSAEAIAHALHELGTEEVGARILLSGVGGITESDITLAAASNAPILGFNVRANKQAREAASRDGIEVRYYNVIYDLVDDIKAAMSGLLSPERRETFLGNAEIKEIFHISKVGKVAGCLVTEGVVERGANVRLIRDDVVIHEGELGTLKRFKDEVKTVESGQECGMNFVKYQDMRPGDIIECFRVEQIARTL